MRYLLIILTVLAACNPSATDNSAAYQGKPEWKNYDLVGQVHTLTEFSFEGNAAVSDPAEAVNHNWLTAFSVFFNHKGQQDSIKEFIRNGQFVDTVTWIIERDAEGLRSRMWSRDQKGGNHGLYVYVNDVAGNEIQSKSYNKDSQLLMIISNSYNQKSQLTESQKADKIGNSTGKMKYYWDSTDHLVKLEEFSKEGGLKYFFKREYDSSGKLLVSNDTSGSTGLITRFSYVTDKNGNYIIRKATQNGRISETVARIIKYY